MPKCGSSILILPDNREKRKEKRNLWDASEEVVQCEKAMVVKWHWRVLTFTINLIKWKQNKLIHASKKALICPLNSPGSWLGSNKRVIIRPTIVNWDQYMNVTFIVKYLRAILIVFLALSQLSHALVECHHQHFNMELEWRKYYYYFTLTLLYGSKIVSLQLHAQITSNLSNSDRYLRESPNETYLSEDDSYCSNTCLNKWILWEPSLNWPSPSEQLHDPNSKIAHLPPKQWSYDPYSSIPNTSKYRKIFDPNTLTLTNFSFLPKTWKKKKNYHPSYPHNPLCLPINIGEIQV